MARITIVGAGVIGMATASMLARGHKVTIVARNLPGDEASIEWASPWAGASFVAGGCASAEEAKMQLDAFAELWRWSVEYPESSVKRIMMEDFHDDKTEEQIWWKNYMPKFRFLPQHSLPKGASIGMTYETLVLRPDVFLPWFRRRLEDMGVEFKRMNLSSLSDARSLGHDVLVNATGFGSMKLTDVADNDIEMIRGQTILVNSSYNKLFLRDTGDTYTYAIPRLDGTVILGGIRQWDSVDPAVDFDICQDIVNRLHDNLPDHFSANLADHQIIGHNVGIRPGRSSGIRLEKEEINGQKIVHAYGVAAGGYIFGFGIARRARDLVEQFLYPHLPPKL